MEGIGFLHAASAYEAPESIEVVPVRVDFQFFESLNWQKLPSTAAIRLLSVALTLAIFSVAGQAFATEKVGSQGSEVVSVQKCLKDLGYFSGRTTGYFGSITKNAVVNFQQANGLKADGVVGKATQRTLDGQCSSAQKIDNSYISSSTSPLKRGSQGVAVTRLQDNLRQLNYFKGKSTGTFGPVTEQAVIKFQRDRGMVADGVVGSKTIAVIQRFVGIASGKQPSTLPVIGGASGSFGGEYPTLRPGNNSPEVKYLQQILKQKGLFNVNETGYFGSITKDAVNRFKSSRELPANGVVDTQTWNQLLMAGSYFPQSNTCNKPILQQDTTGKEVTNLQQRLNELGYSSVPPNGYFGPATKDAVIKLQRDRGLQADGVVDARTWETLGRYCGDTRSFL
jgi:peptidoglycan hydrolase-like protein with peptidoglycan-binding domain